MDKGKLPTKMFLRSNSFQKLCSLAHPMRLRGFKSNREALKSVFESLIVTTRGVIQSVTYRILCFLFLTPFTKLLLSRPLQGLVDAVVSSSYKAGKDGQDGSTNRLNTVRLILKLTLSMIVSTDKSPDVRCDNELKLSEDVNDDEVTPNQDATLKPECPRTTTLSDTAVQTEPEPDPEFFDCREPTESTEPTQTKTCRFLESSSIQQIPQRRPPPSRLVAATFYGCVLCCVAQLSALVYMLSGDAVRFPPGLIFLILALAYIGFVMTRIFASSQSGGADRRKMAAAKKKAEAGGTSKALVPVPEGAIRKQQQNHPKGLHPILAAVSKRIVATLLQYQQPQKGSILQASPAPTPRMSRSATRTRMLLCADDRTISKVKIL